MTREVSALMTAGKSKKLSSGRECLGRSAGAKLIAIDGSLFVLENSAIKRVLKFDSDLGLYTQSLKNKLTGSEYARDTKASEFMANLNGKTLRGYSQPTMHILDGTIQKHSYRLKLVGAATMRMPDGWERLSITMLICYSTAQVIAHYDIHPEWASVRKRLEIIAGDEELRIDKLMFEVMNCFPGSLSDVRMYGRQGLIPYSPFFVCDSDDVIQVHNERLNEGMFIANSAPGPLKRFLVYPQWQDTALCAGYNSDCAPFCKYLDAGESFESDYAITTLYAGRRDDQGNRNVLRQAIRDLLPRYIDDSFMYCTWIPFLKNIDSRLIEDLVDRAHDMGFTSFVIDDGWFSSPGWQVDAEKFPEGLEPLSDAVRSRGMRFGLWFNIGTDYGDVDEYDHHLALDSSGRSKSGGFAARNRCKCLASGHRDRIMQVLSELASRYKVGYFKLDFSSIISPYGLLPLGCHSHDHEYHRDAADAVYECYQSFSIIRGALQDKHPDLIIDFSFEAFGSDRPHIGALMNSQLHHVSNMTSRDPAITKARNVRNVLYEYCTVLPNERILGSLISLDGAEALENMATSMIGAPLVAGDLRKLGPDQCQQIRQIINAVRLITADGPLTEFAKLHGDRYAEHHDWDGFARWSKTGMGLICLFRNDSENFATIRIPGLQSHGQYRLRDVLCDEDLGKYALADFSEGIDVLWSPKTNLRVLTLHPIEASVARASQ